jgi:hypothetical protein
MNMLTLVQRNAIAGLSVPEAVRYIQGITSSEPNVMRDPWMQEWIRAHAEEIAATYHFKSGDRLRAKPAPRWFKVAVVTVIFTTLSVMAYQVERAIRQNQAASFDVRWHYDGPERTP